MILAWWRARQERRAKAVEARQAADWHLVQAQHYREQAKALDAACRDRPLHCPLRWAMQLGVQALNSKAQASTARAGGDEDDAKIHDEAAETFSRWHQQETEKANKVLRMRGAA